MKCLSRELKSIHRLRICRYAHYPFRVGNREKISRDLSAVLERYNVLMSELEMSHQLMDKLNATMHIRMNLVKRWRESVSTRITGQFHTLMRQRGVKGSERGSQKRRTHFNGNYNTRIAMHCCLVHTLSFD